MDENKKTTFGINTYKMLFAMEYILQGLANPFQGITYQPFFNHFKSGYGLSESATQNYFSQSYLAWSFKPVIGFLMDAYGKTRTVLTLLLLSGVILFVLTPFLDVSAIMFFGTMFVLSVVFAATDVAVDRATILSGEEESQNTGRSKAATVGLNQSICWAAIYGTSIVASIAGGWIADNVEMRYLMFLLALVPLSVFFVVRRLPRDTAVSIPLKESVLNFWNGLNTGPILWIILFYFLFHFQPAMGALWTNYQIETLKFSQTQLGFSDGASSLGSFIGVLLFAWIGIRWQDKLGLKTVFKIFILLIMAVNLTQYLLVEPYFSRIITGIHAWIPAVDTEYLRLLYLCGYNFMSAVFISFSSMSTFSLVGAVIPSNAAGSLFAGFMSVANLAYSFSYSSGSWLYDNGMQYPVLRQIQEWLFGITALPEDHMSISLLIFIGSLAFLLSFLSIRMLPDRRVTQSTEEVTVYYTGPEQYNRLGSSALKTINRFAISLSLILFVLIHFLWELDIISNLVITFFCVTFLRKLILDSQMKRRALS